MADNSDGPSNAQNLYSEEDETPHTMTNVGASKVLDGPTRASSTSSLSEAQDPDADAEGEPDDLDADADGIEDDDAMDYSYEQQDIDGARIDDGDESAGQEEEDEEEDGEDEEEEEEEEGEDDSGEEMDLDENASSPPPSPPSRLSDQAHQNGSESNKKPLKLKLKLATQPAASRPPAKRKYVRKAPLVSKSPSARSRSTNDKKANSSNKRRSTGSDEEDDELAEDSLGYSDGDDDRAGNQPGPYQASNGSEGASTGDDTMPTAGQLTVRQRAKEYGEPVTELQSLPMTDSKKKKELTEADRAMEKAEKSRKRKHQNEKKLEDEKTETINRLLKGQVGKAKGSTKTAGRPIDTTEDNTNQVVKAPAVPVLPTMIRRVSSIRSGEYIASLNIPSSILKEHEDHFLLRPSSKVVYPPPLRPPPKTWKLVNGVRVN
ncbi:hypothetical protein PGT21_017694 [Puccinia graminis f. sp. tritici]|uniref:INO80 complex subunit B-like conserved region domain-containing protein n=1 Tax=Puccinia graminis f. sp. tritici TaxID=56615 RepID=A0A5B0LW42_PUCGR|nr:hypothetical protein PGTUg99_035021 [Puccinia graminis f. sp. tritici]KAA1104269.1 hypothetical protein PGT21_017694 [Puccinia graminis f. sp. tritici]